MLNALFAEAELVINEHFGSSGIRCFPVEHYVYFKGWISCRKNEHEKLGGCRRAAKIETYLIRLKYIRRIVDEERLEKLSNTQYESDSIRNFYICGRGRLS